VSERRVHPANTLNELSGEEWLYFTKSLWTTAYPSELGHRRRRAHGANKPPRLMARLIEFFTRGGELVVDPFAGVGGTLLGAAICRTPRRALGFEIEPRWVAAYEDVVRDVLLEQDGRSGTLADLGNADPGGPRTFDPSGCRMVLDDALRGLARLGPGSVDMIATDPPYNPQLRMTMAGGAAATAWANRRTDYAMITDDPVDIANSASYPEYLDRMAQVLGECRRVLRDRGYAVLIVRDAYQEGRYRFTGADLAARAEHVGLVPKGDLVWYQAGTRLRPYGYPRGFVPNIVHQHILVLQAAEPTRQPRSSSAGIHTKVSARSEPAAAPTVASEPTASTGSSSGAPEYQTSDSSASSAEDPASATQADGG
jgi:DNA modification methylase